MLARIVINSDNLHLARTPQHQQQATANHVAQRTIRLPLLRGLMDAVLPNQFDRSVPE